MKAARKKNEATVLKKTYALVNQAGFISEPRYGLVSPYIADARLYKSIKYAQRALESMKTDRFIHPTDLVQLRIVEVITSIRETA